MTAIAHLANSHNQPKAKCNVVNGQEVKTDNKESCGQLHQKQPQAAETQNGADKQQQVEDIGLVKKLTVDCLMYLIRAIINLSDLFGRPIYFIKDRVYEKRAEVERVRSVQIDPSDPESPWHQIHIDSRQRDIESQIDSFDTYDAMMKASFEQNAIWPCYGYREILYEQWIKKPESDKQIRQVKLSEYKWFTYEQFERQIEAARKGFLLEGVRAGDKVMLYADTRPEWQIVSQSLIRLGAIVGTMYSTLGVDGIVHTVNETQVTHIVTQRDKVNRLLRLKSKLPKLNKIIYFETSLKLPSELGGSYSDNETDSTTTNATDTAQFESAKAAGVECICFRSILEQGLKLGVDKVALLEQENKRANGGQKRTKDSLAVIMYTSGSTGIPKGVLISHGNIMATIKSFSYVTKDFVHKPKENVCTAYLPLAHIFEFCIESVMLFHGVRYGFATPHTLTDKSPGLMPGQLGDLGQLKPTVMIIVPLILDRVVQGIKQALKQQSYFKEQLVSYLIDYKIYWQQRHYKTPLVDKIVCKKMAAALGGRAKYVICGSAPLSSQTQTFVRAALSLKLPQGFGTTETCAATSCQLFDDQSTSNVGLPVSGSQIKLEPWLEGNYRPTDKPNPRGEIVVGGEMIAHGYFNLEQQTKEAFYVDNDGRRWYRTGDIGEFLPDGKLKIIDRKKDLVKLQNGEYISLGRIESTLKSNPYTENFCIYANSQYNYVVALGPANEVGLRTLAQQIVDESERRLSPTMMKRLGADQDSLVTALGGATNGRANGINDERRTLLMSDEERQLALDELREVLASYELEDLANNNCNATPNGERKMSALSTDSATGCGGRSRAGSATNPDSMHVNERLKRLCDNKLIIERVLGHICRMAQERNLLSLEAPRKLLLLAEEWTEDKNLVTAAMKIRRNYIYKRYQSELNELYVTSNQQRARC